MATNERELTVQEVTAFATEVIPGVAIRIKERFPDDSNGSTNKLTISGSISFHPTVITVTIKW